MARAADIELVRRTGKRLRTGHLDVRIAPSPLSRLAGDGNEGDRSLRRGRVGVIVPKYGRSIVERNRLRRRLRELVRTKVLPTMGAHDVLIRALPAAYGTTFERLTRDITALVPRLG